MTKPGRQFVHVPGPTNIPFRVRQALSRPTIDHHSEEFAEITRRTVDGLKDVFRCSGPIFLQAAAATGAWEAALVNTMSPGETVLIYETGHFAALWKQMAGRIGLRPVFVGGDWRTGADPVALGDRLRDDREHVIKAVCIVHNETSTGCTSDIAAIRRVMDAAGHPALLLVDAVSSAGSMEYLHDEWKVDVTVCGSQKGLMLPPGLAITAISDKALKASRAAWLPRSYWSWQEMMDAEGKGAFAHSPATNLLFGLVEALDMLREEGLPEVFARHARHAEATRRAVVGWGLETQCRDPRCASDTLTAVILPPNHSADAFRQTVLERFDLVLGEGLARLSDRVFRIGHLGDLNDLMLLGALAGVEMGLALTGVPHRAGGAQQAIDYLTERVRTG